MRKQLMASMICLLLLTFTFTGACAQTTPRTDSIDGSRFEVGGHLYGFSGYDVSDNGVGGRFAYNFNRYFAVETEVNASLAVGDESIGVNGAQVFAGIKAGRRMDKFGLFAKVRPGVVTNFTRATGPGFFDREHVTKPALDIGGIIEYYPTKRTILRLDVSDVIIGFGDDRIEEVRCPCPRRLGTTNNLGLSFGFGFRF